MDELSSPQFNSCGEHKSLHFKPIPESPAAGIHCDIMAFAWVDRELQCFISTCSHLRPAEPILHQCLRQVEDVSSNQSPAMVAMSIPIPTAAHIHCRGCGMIDSHNRLRQDGQKMKKKLETKEWSKRVNLSALSVIVVDSFLACKGCTGVQETFNEFTHKLADELLEHNLTPKHQHLTSVHNGFEFPTSKCPTNVPHLTPQKSCGLILCHQMERRTKGKLGCRFGAVCVWKEENMLVVQWMQ